MMTDLDNALVWVYFHSNVEEYNRVECWGPLVEAAKVWTNTHDVPVNNFHWMLII